MNDTRMMHAGMIREFALQWVVVPSCNIRLLQTSSRVICSFFMSPLNLLKSFLCY